MDKFDDDVLTVLRYGMSAYARTQKYVALQIEDAKDDAIIVNPVDASAAAAIRKAANADCKSPISNTNIPDPAKCSNLAPVLSDLRAFANADKVRKRSLDPFQFQPVRSWPQRIERNSPTVSGSRRSRMASASEGSLRSTTRMISRSGFGSGKSR